MAPLDIRSQIRELGIRPSKRLGQHYLLDEGIANRQVQYANIRKSDTVLEIGPGLGILTNIMSKRAKRVIAIEMDPVNADYLHREIPDAEIITGDVLKVSFPSFDKVVSNLPFNISSPLTFKLLDQEFELGILMYQKEFAQRLVASKGNSDYSRLSVNAYYRAECEILEVVPRSAFFPEPNVDASIVKIIPRPPPFKVAKEDHFLRLVKALFSHRRKQIGNSLLMEWKELCDNKETMRRMVASLPDKEMRVEDLSPQEIGELSNWISEEKFNLGNGHHKNPSSAQDEGR